MGAMPLITRAFVAITFLQRGLAQVKIMAPQSLIEQFKDTRGRIEGTTATFGAPYYNERILGQLRWGDSKRNRTHCVDEDYEIPPPEEVDVPGKEYKEVRLINIVMVRRGTCTFVTKVKVARAKGAHAVIIVDTDSRKTPQEIQQIIMADDGFGDSVTIPSLMISQQEGEKLIDAVKRPGSKVIVELAWTIPMDKTVQMDLWMSSASAQSQQFLQEFSPNRKALDAHMRFVPHYHVFSMSTSKESRDYNHMCSDEFAEYCAEDPDGSGYITGEMVLDEDVRQLCIHEQTSVATIDTQNSLHVYAAKYWDYVERFPGACPLEGTKGSAQSFSSACAESLMASVGINVDAIKGCIQDTKVEKLAYERENIAWSPTALRINGWRYSGVLDADIVTNAICSAFTTAPRACARITTKRNPFDESASPAPAAGVGMSTLLGVLFGLALLACGAMQLYKRAMTRSIHTQLREEVMLEVQSQMESYKQLSC